MLNNVELRWNFETVETVQRVISEKCESNAKGVNTARPFRTGRKIATESAILYVEIAHQTKDYLSGKRLAKVTVSTSGDINVFYLVSNSDIRDVVSRFIDAGLFCPIEGYTKNQQIVKSKKKLDASQHKTSTKSKISWGTKARNGADDTSLVDKSRQRRLEASTRLVSTATGSVKPIQVSEGTERFIVTKDNLGRDVVSLLQWIRGKKQVTLIGRLIAGKLTYECGRDIALYDRAVEWLKRNDKVLTVQQLAAFSNTSSTVSSVNDHKRNKTPRSVRKANQVKANRQVIDMRLTGKHLPSGLPKPVKKDVLNAVSITEDVDIYVEYSDLH